LKNSEKLGKGIFIVTCSARQILLDRVTGASHALPL
jgi:hypothetical protein